MSSRSEQDKNGSEETSDIRASRFEEITSAAEANVQTSSANGTVAESSSSLEDSTRRPSNTQASPSSAACCIVIPNLAGSQSHSAKLMIIDTKDLVHGIFRPRERNFSNACHGAGCSRSDEVTVNLSSFLTYARRSHCDIMIPSSRNRCYPSSSHVDSAPAIVLSEQQNFLQPSSGAAATSYHPNEFIGLNNVSPRSSVLMPNLYSGSDDIRPPAVDFNAPPPYDAPFKLPTYEEVQREKELEADGSLGNNEPQQNQLPRRTVSFLTVDGEAAAAAAAAADSESKLLGTDFMFAISFFLALIFNWVGFLLMLCFCHTIAARYGALSGFGLSLAKWTVIVKQTSANPGQSVWLWWLVAVFGILICVRSLFQYIHIKRGWRLMSATMQERLLVYY